MEYLAFFGPLRGWEPLIILLAVLIIFGPKNLPKLGKMMGNALREFKSGASKAADAVNDDDDETHDARLGNDSKSVAEKKERERVG